jgi:hypothetical protein
MRRENFCSWRTPQKIYYPWSDAELPLGKREKKIEFEIAE